MDNDRTCPLCGGILTPGESKLDQSTGSLPATAWSCAVYDYHGPHYVRTEPRKDLPAFPGR